MGCSNMLTGGGVAEIVAGRSMLTASGYTCLIEVKGKDKDGLLQGFFNLYSL